MTAPNIVNTSIIYGKTAGIVLTSTSGDLLINSNNSNKVLKINSLYLTNLSANSVSATISWNNGTTSFIIIKDVVIPANSVLVLIDKNAPLYLEENCKLIGISNADGNQNINAIISYEEIS